MFESPLRLVLGLLTGIAFGFLLQKGRVAKHSVIVGQLVLRDQTVLKIMVTAIAVGAIGYWAMVALGVTAVSVKPAQMGGVLVGALLFGSGMAVLGYCPGTTVAAVGEGRRDAMVGLLGMLAAAFTFVIAYPVFADLQRAVVDWGKVTWPDVTNVAPIVYVVVLAAAGAAFYLVSKSRHARHSQ